jgi:hypothetical protein
MIEKFQGFRMHRNNPQIIQTIKKSCLNLKTYQNIYILADGTQLFLFPIKNILERKEDQE